LFIKKIQTLQKSSSFSNLQTKIPKKRFLLKIFLKNQKLTKFKQLNPKQNRGDAVSSRFKMLTPQWTLSYFSDYLFHLTNCKEPDAPAMPVNIFKRKCVKLSNYRHRRA
jgi:hypothetical protein